jgi:predicted dehydrogenase
MVRVGILGAGFMGKTHAEAYKQLPNAQIAGIGEVDESLGGEFAKEFACEHYVDAEELIRREDVDIIDVCLPSFLHEKFVIQAAREGKHILCEKPFTLSMESADRMIDAVNKAGVSFMIAQVVRFWPDYMKIKKFSEEGVLGSIKMVYANRLSQQPGWSDWFKDVNKSGGGLFDLHLHDIDYVYYLLGPAETVYAVGEKDEAGAWNHIVTSLTYAGGARAVVEGSNVMTNGYPFTMVFRVTGSDGTAEFTFSAGSNLEDRDSATNKLVLYSTDKDSEIVPADKKDAYFNEIEYFVQCVDQGIKPEKITPEQSREVLNIIHSIRQSLETNTVVRL